MSVDAFADYCDYGISIQKDYINGIESSSFSRYYNMPSRRLAGIRGIDYFVDDFGDIHSDEDSAIEANDWGQFLEHSLDEFYQSR